jgi:hypothetical protein
MRILLAIWLFSCVPALSQSLNIHSKWNLDRKDAVVLKNLDTLSFFKSRVLQSEYTSATVIIYSVDSSSSITYNYSGVDGVYEVYHFYKSVFVRGKPYSIMMEKTIDWYNPVISLKDIVIYMPPRPIFGSDELTMIVIWYKNINQLRILSGA